MQSKAHPISASLKNEFSSALCVYCIHVLPPLLHLVSYLSIIYYLLSIVDYLLLLSLFKFIDYILTEFDVLQHIERFQYWRSALISESLQSVYFCLLAFIFYKKTRGMQNVQIAKVFCKLFYANFYNNCNLPLLLLLLLLCHCRFAANFNDKFIFFTINAANILPSFRFFISGFSILDFLQNLPKTAIIC